MSKFKLTFIFTFCIIGFALCALAEGPDPEFNIDLNSATVPLPKIFKPNVDLSGRGYHRDVGWPQGLAAAEVLDTWQKDIGFGGTYRLQYNLWEINQLAKDKENQDKLLANYESVIKRISDSGGTVILDIFGTPAGLGKVLDKKSPPVNLKAFKELAKSYIKNLSCDKHYNIWYEVWSAPDLDDFFLGRKQEYLNLYRTVAEAAKELEAEYKIHIPVGGPAVSWWFQNLEPNTIVTPEHSLIYELIKLCYSYHLPLDFISWHAFSTDPQVEKELTVYKKPFILLVRDWLGYFKFDRNTPLVVDEWNYDRGVNVAAERGQESHIGSSYIAARLNNMYSSGLDQQVYFSLEDFQNNKEKVTRNTGLFWFNEDAGQYNGGSKSMYNAFRILNLLGQEMFVVSSGEVDQFCGVIATRKADAIAILAYNYIDPSVGINFISRSMSSLSPGERKSVLGLIKLEKLARILSAETDIATLRVTRKVKDVLQKAKALKESADRFKSTARNIKINLKNIKGDYIIEGYSIDSSCSKNCKFAIEKRQEFSASGEYQETLAMNPYSVVTMIIKPKPKELESAPVKTNTQEVAVVVNATQSKKE